jgi:hypothetical protein
MIVATQVFDGGTNLSYDYEAADWAEKRKDVDWGDANTYQPARTLYVDYPFFIKKRRNNLRLSDWYVIY